MQTTVYRTLDELPLVLRVEDLMAVLGIGRNAVYALVRSDQIRSLKVGVKLLFPSRQ